MMFMLGLFLTIVSGTWFATFIMAFASSRDEGWSSYTSIIVTIMALVLTAGITLITH